MPLIRSSGAWIAGLFALFALLRGLRWMVGAEGRLLVLGVAIAVIVLAALMPVARDRASLSDPQLEVRKAVQFFGATGVLLLAVFLDAGIVLAAVLGLAAAALVPLVWPPPRGPAPQAAGQG